MYCHVGWFDCILSKINDDDDDDDDDDDVHRFMSHKNKITPATSPLFCKHPHGKMHTADRDILNM